VFPARALGLVIFQAHVRKPKNMKQKTQNETASASQNPRETQDERLNRQFHELALEAVKHARHVESATLNELRDDGDREDGGNIQACLFNIERYDAVIAAAPAAKPACNHKNKEWRLGNWTCTYCGHVTRETDELLPQETLCKSVKDWSKRLAVAPEAPGLHEPAAKSETRRGEPAHTPGPWHWDAGSGYIVGTDHKTVCGFDMPSALAMRPANARLIAAAPELLAALRIDTVTLETVFANDSKNIAAKCCIERNNKLIANVEGKQ
jgi:hypothetical protein